MQVATPPGIADVRASRLAASGSIFPHRLAVSRLYHHAITTHLLQVGGRPEDRFDDVAADIIRGTNM